MREAVIMRFRSIITASHYLGWTFVSALGEKTGAELTGWLMGFLAGGIAGGWLYRGQMVRPRPSG